MQPSIEKLKGVGLISTTGGGRKRGRRGEGFKGELIE